MARPTVLSPLAEPGRRSIVRLQAVAPGRRVPVAVFGTVLVLLLVQWAAFFPGLLSWDSYTYVWEVTTGHWIADHSIAYDALLWLSLKATGGIWALTLGQCVVAAGVVAYTAAGIHRLGARGRWVWASAVVLGVLPSTASFTMFVWKDVAFSLSAVLAFGAVVHLVAGFLEARRAGEKPKAARSELWMLALGFSGIALFRNNDAPTAVVAGVVLIVFLPGLRRSITVVTAAAVAVWALLAFALYPALGVRSPTADSMYALNYGDISVVYQEAPQTFTAADLQLMAKVAPLAHWRDSADCYRVDPLMWAPFDKVAANRYNSQLLGLWTRVLERSPRLVVDAHLCRSSVAWTPIANSGGPGTYVSPPYSPGGLPGSWAYTSNSAGITGSLHGNPYLPALVSAPVSGRLHHVLSRVYVISSDHSVTRVIWQGAAWCYLTYAIVLLAAFRRRNRALCALVGVTLGLQLMVLAANPSQLARYMIAPIFIGLMCLPLVAPWRPHPRAGSGD